MQVNMQKCELKNFLVSYTGKYPDCEFKIDIEGNTVKIGCYDFTGFYNENDDDEENEQRVAVANLKTPTDCFLLEKEFIDYYYGQGTIDDDCYYGEIDGREVVFEYYCVNFPEDVNGHAGQYMVKDSNGYYRAFNKKDFALLFEIVED